MGVKGESWRGERGGISWFIEVFLQLGCDGVEFHAVENTLDDFAGVGFCVRDFVGILDQLRNRPG
jgi:hypothetical protein